MNPLVAAIASWKCGTQSNRATCEYKYTMVCTWLTVLFGYLHEKNPDGTVMVYVHWTRSGHPSWSACGGFVALLFFSNNISSSILCCTRHHKFFLAFLFFNFRFGGKLNEETTKHVDDFVGVPTMRFMEFRGFDTAHFSPFYIWKITKNWLPRFLDRFLMYTQV